MAIFAPAESLPSPATLDLIWIYYKEAEDGDDGLVSKARMPQSRGSLSTLHLFVFVFAFVWWSGKQGKDAA